MLSIKDVSKSYHQRGTVLDNLSLEVTRGETIAVMGPSGSGKTTMMNIIGLLDKPDSGHIYFNGSDILSFSENEAARYRNQHIGFIFQEHLLLPHLKVMENILLPLMAGQLKDEEYLQRVEYAELLMQRTGISDLSTKFPSEISGGEAQRAALVRALVNHPTVILADEPTGSLDAVNANILGDLLVDINREFSVSLIIATHSEKLAGKMNRIYTLTEGRLKLN